MMMKEGERSREREMRGVGGPLLCIGDLLSDVADDGNADGDRRQTSAPSSPSSSSNDYLSPYALQGLFQENYDFLIDALLGTDHSWTASTLKLCAALEKADKLVLSANSNMNLLLEKVQVLEKILRRGDAAVMKAKEILQVPRED